MLILEVLVLFLALVGQSAGQDCPDECSCINGRVTCDDPDMKEIPDDIPPDTTSLIIMGKPTTPFSISKIKGYKLKYLTKLTQLYIVFAGVESVDVSAFQNLAQLKLLDLRHNKIKDIFQDTFKGMDNLELINLSGNEYLNLQPGTVANLPSLRDLYLSDLKLRSLDPKSFQGLDSLMHLDLSGNSLRRLDKDIFEPLKSLTSLDITGNRFKSLDDEMESSFKKLESLALGNNPWQCNCDIRWMKQLPMKFIYDSTVFSADRVVVCNGPDELRYKNLKDVPDVELKCIEPSIKDCVDIADVKGHEARIVCDITGDPFPELSWTLPDKIQIHSLDELDPKKFVYSENGTLLIQSLDVPHNGTWNIKVENSKGHDETTVHIDVGILPTVEDCQDVSGKEGYEQLIECNIKGYPFPDIQWKLPDKSVIESQKTIDRSKYEIKMNQKLLIKSLSMHDEGKWTVLVRNKYGNGSATFEVKVAHITTLSTIGTTESTGSPPTIQNCKDVFEEEGRKIVIECNITGSPFPSISWFLPDSMEISSTDKKLPKNFMVLKGRLLVIKSLEDEHDGTWEVHVKNPHGEDSAFFDIKVKKKDLPAPKTDWILIGASCGGGVALLSLIIITIVCCKNKKTKVGDIEQG